MPMSSPSPLTKSLKVSAETHQRIHDLAVRLETTADGALNHLLGISSVRVPLSDVQRTRWQAYADASGVSLAAWIMLRVEAAMQYGHDPGTMHLVLATVRAIADAEGVTVPRGPVPRPPAPPAGALPEGN